MFTHTLSLSCVFGLCFHTHTYTAVHARLNHPNIVSLIGAGITSKGVRFVVLERLDGGTLTQMLGYDTRIRDRRRRFWKKKQLSFLDVLRCARSIADAMAYCNRDAIPGCMVLHRDLKPDNIGFTLSGVVKVMDFGLAKIVENATPNTDDVYEMSGETGSLRYMSPEVADSLPYNHKADVYSFGMFFFSFVTPRVICCLCVCLCVCVYISFFVTKSKTNGTLTALF